jgi:hypothetical protein
VLVESDTLAIGRGAGGEGASDFHETFPLNGPR